MHCNVYVIQKISVFSYKIAPSSVLISLAFFPFSSCMHGFLMLGVLMMKFSGIKFLH